jgi:hypothetical protein
MTPILAITVNNNGPFTAIINTTLFITGNF